MVLCFAAGRPVGIIATVVIGAQPIEDGGVVCKTPEFGVHDAALSP